MLYKGVNGFVALPVINQLEIADNCTRRNHDQKFKHIRTNSSVYKNSFVPRAIIDRNNLLGSTVEARMVDSFKANLERNK